MYEHSTFSSFDVRNICKMLNMKVLEFSIYIIKKNVYIT